MNENSSGAARDTPNQASLRELQSGLKIFDAREDRDLPTILITSPITPVTDVISTQLVSSSTAYRSGALIPGFQRREATQSERALLLCNDASTAAVRVISISQWLLNKLREQARNRTLFVKEDIHTALESLLDSRVRLRDFTTYRESCYTTTAIGSVFREFQGFHVDSGRKPRVLVNLDSEPREFIFLNLSVRQLAEESGLADDQVVRALHPIKVNQAPYERKILTSYLSDYPLVSILLYPGDGWIMETPHLIAHDGSSPFGPNYSFGTVLA